MAIENEQLLNEYIEELVRKVRDALYGVDGLQAAINIDSPGALAVINDLASAPVGEQPTLLQNIGLGVLAGALNAADLAAFREAIGLGDSSAARANLGLGSLATFNNLSAAEVGDAAALRGAIEFESTSRSILSGLGLGVLGDAPNYPKTDLSSAITDIPSGVYALGSSNSGFPTGASSGGVVRLDKLHADDGILTFFERASSLSNGAGRVYTNYRFNGAWVGWRLSYDDTSNTGWIEPTLQNGWANWGSGWPNASYFKDSMGWVHLSGLIKPGTYGEVIFTLPVGFRPRANIMTAIVTGASSGNTGRCDVNASSGQVATSGSITATYIDLGGFSPFLAEN